MLLRPASTVGVHDGAGPTLPGGGHPNPLGTNSYVNAGLAMSPTYTRVKVGSTQPTNSDWTSRRIVGEPVPDHRLKPSLNPATSTDALRRHRQTWLTPKTSGIGPPMGDLATLPTAAGTHQRLAHPRREWHNTRLSVGRRKRYELSPIAEPFAFTL